MGYTPEFTVGVWVGNFNGSSMRAVSAVTGAAPILHDVMEYLHRRFGTTWFDLPMTIVERPVHPLTGHLPAETRSGAVMERVVASRVPQTEQTADCDTGGRVKLGPEYIEWASSVDNQIRDRVMVEGSGQLYLVAPQLGSTFLIDPDVPSWSLVPLVASGSDRLAWRVVRRWRWARKEGGFLRR